MADKRITVDDIVGELRSGMTIGIGGWGSRRKPMAVVRAICRSDLDRPDRRRLRRSRRRPALRHRQGAQGGLRLRHARLHRARPPLAGRPPARPGRGDGGRRGHVLPRACRRRRGGSPSCPPGPGWAPTSSPSTRTCASSAPPTAPGSPYLADPADADVELVAMPALHLDAAIVHTNRADTAGNGQVLSPDPFFDTLFLGAAERRFVTTERIVADGDAGRRGPPALDRADPPHAHRRRGRDAAAGRTSPPTRPTTAATRPSRRSTRRPRPTRPSGRPSPAATSSSTRTSTRPGSRSGRTR